MPTLSPEQQRAADQFADWYAAHRGRPDVFRLFAPAGCGKTYVAAKIAARLGGDIRFMAPTGKAAWNLRRKGCPTATTIHKAIYVPRERCSQALRELKAERATLAAQDPPAPTDEILRLDREIRALNDDLRSPTFALNHASDLADADLAILDETSMVGEQIARDLLSFGVPVLALGDKHQLPPVKDRAYFMDAEPDAELTEIHRQASGSPVLALATRIRQGQPIEYGDQGDEDEYARVVPKGTLTVHDLARADQVLVGKNATRRALNRRIREEVYGRTDPLPVKGDKLCAWRNDYDHGILNGSLWEVEYREDLNEDRMLVAMTSLDGDGERVVVECHRHPFEGRDIPFYEIKEAQLFEFGTCLTVHKAQGSEFDEVVVVDQSYVFRHEARRWQYTAATRAAKRLTISR